MSQNKQSKCLVYGGHIISLCRALSYNGLGNGIWLTAIHSGSHCNPSFAGDTIYCQSTIVEKTDVDDRDDIGLVKIQMLGFKNNTPAEIGTLYQKQGGRTKYHRDVVLALEYSVIMVK